jgi:SNF2 family DNA or RNA helicase
MKTMSQKLRQYQQQDASFLLQADCLANFSQQRTGKTPVMCEVIQQRAVKTIVVCPSSLVLNWKEELNNWTDMDTYIGKGTSKKRQELYEYFNMAVDPSVLVISIGIAKQDVALLQTMDYKMIIVDEAHFLRNHKTVQSKALYSLARNAKYRYTLTGTPATNSPVDIYGLLAFLKPDRYTSYWQFVERYFNVESGHFGKKIGDFKSPLRKKELHEIVEAISVQRKRKDIMKWLPAKQHQVIKLEMGTKQAKQYKSMLEVFETEDGEISASGVLAQLTRLRQITLAPSILDLDAPSAKEDFLKEWIENNPDEQVLVFSNFSSYLRVLKGKFPTRTALLTGAESPNVRQAVVKQFQAGHLQVLFANITSAGVGLTLDKAGTVIFLDRDYTPTKNEQAEDRIVATTEESNKSALIIDLVCVGSIDEKIIQMVREKKNITKVINEYASIKEFMKC